MHGSSRATSLLAWLLVVQIGLPVPPAHAASPDSSTLPTARGLAPSGSGTGGAAPATDRFTGAAAHSIPIEVPPGTGGLTPALALQYSSQARGDSWVGSGWSLGLPAITRSLKDGVPRYDDATDVFELGGEELVPATSNPALPRRYHTLHESFARIVHEANGSWTLTRKDGVALRFGVTVQARIANAAGQPFQWLLEEQEDRHGNAWVASYDHRDPGTAYLAVIRYTLRRTPGGALQSLDGSSAKDRRIEFVLESAPRSDVATGYRAGFGARIAHRLDAIDVKVGATLVRRYDLRYAQSADTFRSLLTAVALYGNDAAAPSPRAPFVTSFAYHANVAAGTTGWQSVPWSWPANLSLVDATWRDGGVRLADVDGDALPDLVKALAQQSHPDPKLASFTLTADSGVYLNDGTGFAATPSAQFALPSFPSPNGTLPFSLAWHDGAASRTTGLDVLDLTGDGRADLVGAVRDLDGATGDRRGFGMPTWFAGTANGFVAAADTGDVLQDGFWGLNRSGIVDIAVTTPARGTTSGNARFADLTGDGLPELVVRGAEIRYTAFGAPPPLASSNWSCVDQRRANYYFENRGALRLDRAATVDTTLASCATQIRVATDFQQCDLADYIGCGYQILYNEAQPVQFSDPFWGTFPWYWLVNWEFGAADVDVNGDGLADTISASWDPYGYGAAATAFLNDGERGYLEDAAWALPNGIYLYELGARHSVDTGLRFADVNGDGRVDLVGAAEGYANWTWLNDGDVDEAAPSPWVGSAPWAVPAGFEFVDADGRDNGVRLADIDGDGMTDLVRSAGGTSEVRLNRGSIPDLLTQVTSPLGARTHYAYEVSTQHDTSGADGAPDLPFVVPVVASVTVSPSPGAPGNVIGSTTYEYDGGFYDAAARAFRGFARVTETRPDGRRTIRVHHQTPALTGRIASETVLDAAGHSWARLATDYVADATPPYVVLPARVDRSEFDGAATPRVSRTEIRYDGGGAIVHGNPTAVIEWGEISGAGTDVVPGDTRTTETTYFANDAVHLVDRVRTHIVRAGAMPGTGAILHESRFAYDGDASGAVAPAVGDLTRRIDVLADPARPDPTTTFGYDGYGNLTHVTDPRANAGENGGTTTTEYDATYHTFPRAVVNALGHRSEVSYASPPGCAVVHSAGAGLVGQERSPNDLAAGTSRTRCYDVFGRIVSAAGPAGLTWATWSYTDTPLAVATTESRKASASAMRVATSRYDGLGRLVAREHTGPGGQMIDDTRIVYDAMGRVVSETQPAYGAPGAATTYAYDPLDRVVATTLPGPGRVHAREYDRGRIERVDPNGDVVRHIRDAFGRIVRVEELAGASTWVTQYAYDAGDRLTRITDHHGNLSTASYDRLGRRTRITDPDIGYRDFSYDANGNLLTERVSGLETITWTYDKLGRPRTKTGTSPRNWPGVAILWSYDGAPNGIGLPTARNDDDAHTHRVLDYDLLGRATRERYTLLVANQHRHFDFETGYDPLGQPVTRKHPTGTVIQFARDVRGHLTSVASGAASPDAAAIEWTADGRVAAWTAPGGVVTTARYGPTSRRFEALEVDGPGPGLLADKRVHYDPADRVTSIVDGAGPNGMTLGYDALGRLDRTTRFEGGAWVPRTHSYDAIGNLTCRDATGANCAGGTRLVYPSAPGDALQRATSHRATTVAGAASVYDASGAVLTLGARRFYYDAFAQLSEVWDGGSLALRADYDGNGRNHRLWSPATGEWTYLPTDDFEWDESSHVARVHVTLGGARIATHAMPLAPPAPNGNCAGAAPGAPLRDPSPLDLGALFAPGLAALLVLRARRSWIRVAPRHRARVLVATGTGTAFLLVALVPVPFARRGDAVAQSGLPASLYYHGDHLGSVLVVTDASGAVVGSPSAFEPWGRLVSGGSLATPFGFNGKRRAGNLYDYGARWYDPNMGRFLQPDPLIADPYDPQGLSRYAYVRNDPVSRVDPTGAWSISASAWAGQIDNHGFTGIVASFDYAEGGNYSISARGLVGGIPVAQYSHVVKALGEIGRVMEMGAFQLFNMAGVTFSQGTIGDVGAGPDSEIPDLLQQGPNPRMSQAGLDFLLSQEGFSSTAYDDFAGYPTIGFGHKILEGERFDTPMSVPDAAALFLSDVSRVVDPHLGSETIHVALSQNQIDAVGSLIFNIGGGAFSNSTLLRHLNAGNLNAAGEQFGRWIYSNGKIARGLVARREEERRMFLGR